MRMKSTTPRQNGRLLCRGSDEHAMADWERRGCVPPRQIAT
jgi:hypothetical protein